MALVRRDMKLFYLAVIWSSYQSICESILVNPLIADLAWPYVKGPFSYAVQSPTNIDTSRARPLLLDAITFHLKWDKPDDAVPLEIENTGYYLEVHVKEEVVDRPSVTGGPLMEDTFLLEQMHFHWGESDECGSEHWMDDECFSCEMHVVLYNEKYVDYKEAQNYEDGLAVLAFFGEASDVDNQSFNELIGKIPQIIEPESKTNGLFHEEFRFLEILFQQITYFTIPGSLTTPPYFETVCWIFYFTPFNISHKQLSAFRDLKSKNGEKMITHNDRELQPFGPRPIITPLLNKEPDCQN